MTSRPIDPCFCIVIVGPKPAFEHQEVLDIPDIETLRKEVIKARIAFPRHEIAAWSPRLDPETRRLLVWKHGLENLDDAERWHETLEFSHG